MSAVIPFPRQTRRPAPYCKLFYLADHGKRPHSRWVLLLLDVGESGEAFADVVGDRENLSDILADAEFMRAQGLRIDLGGHA